MLIPWRNARFRRIAARLITSPERTVVMSRIQWSVRIDASGKSTRSQEEFVRSRSSQSVLFASAGSTAERMIRASPQTCSLFIGLRLCGIVDEPTCFAPNASSTSPISVRWRVSDFNSYLVERGGNIREEHEIFRVPVAGDYLV